MPDDDTLFLQLTPDELELLALGLHLTNTVAEVWMNEERRLACKELAEKMLLAGKAQEFFCDEALELLDQYTLPGEDDE